MPVCIYNEHNKKTSTHGIWRYNRNSLTRHSVHERDRRYRMYRRDRCVSILHANLNVAYSISAVRDPCQGPCQARNNNIPVRIHWRQFLHVHGQIFVVVVVVFHLPWKCAEEQPWHFTPDLWVERSKCQPQPT